MQPSLPMLKSRGFELGSDRPTRDPFVTIDDVIRLAKDLVARLSRLGEYKHPLAVRKGVAIKKVERKEVKSMQDDQNSTQVRAGSRTYFVDIETAREGGKRYLKITESRFKGEGGKRERTSIIVFPEHVREFAQAVSEMAAKLS